MPVYDPHLLHEKRKDLIISLHNEYIELERTGRGLSTKAIEITDEIRRLVSKHLEYIRLIEIIEIRQEGDRIINEYRERALRRVRRRL